MAAPICLECGNVIRESEEPHEGQQITCAECGARLEVINLVPLELDWFYCEPCYEQTDV